MRLLLDESVPAGLRRYLPGHIVMTVVERGWGGTKNGALLALAAAEFDALITVDKNLPYQQNLAKLPISIVILDTRSNELNFLIPLVPLLVQTLSNLQPRTITHLKL